MFILEFFLFQISLSKSLNEFTLSFGLKTASKQNFGTVKFRFINLGSPLEFGNLIMSPLRSRDSNLNIFAKPNKFTSPFG